MAPRPHNSGHYTQNACTVSQFELQVRAMAGLPLVQPRLHSPTVMLNILGDLWFAADGSQRSPAWDAVLALPGTHLHLYGKLDARHGRKWATEHHGRHTRRFVPRHCRPVPCWSLPPVLMHTPHAHASTNLRPPAATALPPSGSGPQCSRRLSNGARRVAGASPHRTVYGLAAGRSARLCNAFSAKGRPLTTRDRPPAARLGAWRHTTRG
jgi:hypothetical protein